MTAVAVSHYNPDRYRSTGPGYFQLEVVIPNGYLALILVGGHRLCAEILGTKKARTVRKRILVRAFWGLVRITRSARYQDLQFVRTDNHSFLTEAS
jgi:hypothetical protein